MQNMTKKILERAANLVSAGWAQGVVGRYKNGDACGWDDSEAVSWCALGAINRAAMDEGHCLGACAAVDRLRHIVGYFVVAWNDAPERTQAQVVRALRSAARSKGII